MPKAMDQMSKDSKDQHSVEKKSSVKAALRDHLLSKQKRVIPGTQPEPLKAKDKVSSLIKSRIQKQNEYDLAASISSASIAAGSSDSPLIAEDDQS